MAKKLNEKNLKPQRIAGLRPLTVGLIALLMGSFAVSCGSRGGRQTQGIPEEQQLKQQLQALTRREQMLSAELSMAKSPNPYLSIDFLNRKIELRVQGRTLRSFPINKIKTTGYHSSPAQAWAEIEAKPLQLPERAKMVPGGGEATTSSIATQNPWGPKRMPMDYDLFCKDDRAVGIRSLPSTQTRFQFTRWFIGSYRQAWNWIRNITGGRKSDYRESLEIWLPEEDAQMLFWSLPRQFGILLLNPS
jgi:hypothetical protein